MNDPLEPPAAAGGNTDVLFSAWESRSRLVGLLTRFMLTRPWLAPAKTAALAAVWNERGAICI
jgi:hypothetical protein